MNDNEITIGEFRRQLLDAPDDAKLTFGGGLTVFRIRHWTDGSVFVEFNEPQAELTPEFKTRNPSIKVAFISVDSAKWNEQGTVGTVDVTAR